MQDGVDVVNGLGKFNELDDFNELAMFTDLYCLSLVAGWVRRANEFTGLDEFYSLPSFKRLDVSSEPGSSQELTSSTDWRVEWA